jgi:hypothetical protein
VPQHVAQESNVVDPDWAKHGRSLERPGFMQFAVVFASPARINDCNQAEAWLRTLGY